jgi:ribosomal protein S27E
MQVSLEPEQFNNETNTATVAPTQTSGEQSLVACPACTAKTILFSRTIQTFCFTCGTPVTHLDQDGMYYETLSPAFPQ